MSTLSNLALEYDNWRKSKKRRSDKIPDALLSKTREAAREFGFAAVQRVTKVTPSQLGRCQKVVEKRQAPKPSPRKGEERLGAYTVVEVPVSAPGQIDVLLPGGLIIRSQDMATCLKIVEILENRG